MRKRINYNLSEMEQNIIDTSKYKIGLWSLDSRFAEYKGKTGSEWRITPPQPLKNIMRIRMASVEIPLVEQTFTEAKGNTSFYIRIGSNPNAQKLTPIINGNYNAATLCSNVELALKGLLSTFTCVLDNATGMVTIMAGATFTIDFLSDSPSVGDQPTHWGLGYYLGFRKPVQTATQNPSTGRWFITGTSVINVQPNPYYILRLKCPEEIQTVTHRLAGGNFVSAFAKILLKDNYYTLQFDDNSNLMRKEYSFLAPVTIPFFHFYLEDPYGHPVNMFDTDWSVTIEVTEVVNSKTYGTISDTYARK